MPKWFLARHDANILGIKKISLPHTRAKHVSLQMQLPPPFMLFIAHAQVLILKTTILCRFVISISHTLSFHILQFVIIKFTLSLPKHVIRKSFANRFFNYTNSRWSIKFPFSKNNQIISFPKYSKTFVSFLKISSFWE